MQRLITRTYRSIVPLATVCLLTLISTVSVDFWSLAFAVENPSPRISRLETGPNVQYELQSKLIDAMPGDVIELAEGHFQFHRQLDITTSHLTIRGAGSNKTVLSFKGQASGGAGLEATGDQLLLEGFAVEDTAGNAIKVLGADGVTFRDVRTEWTGPASSTNGAYGIYPVQCSNVLIERCTAIGASDAGIYVGQSRNVIVRSNRAERNVAGIEIENTIHADVYDNIATKNTGGILVFDLPGLQIKSGRQIRVHDNQVTDNNHLNFAAKGNVVASVPPGMGIMVMATDEVELDHNTIKHHQTTGVALLAYQASSKRLKKRDTTEFDPYPELISIHENKISDSGYAPAGEMGLLLAPFVGGVFPDIFWDGVGDPTRMKNESLTERQIPAIENNIGARFTNFDLSHMTPRDLLTGRHSIASELTPHQIKRVQIPKVVLPPPKSPGKDASNAVLVYRTAKQKLSEYELFKGTIADHVPAKHVYPYELNTPLFSDYASKHRFFKIPEGKQIRYSKEGTIQFPIGTVISKTFAYPIDMTDPSQGERLLETRIEFRRDDGWFGFSYLWNEQQTEATLALGGSEINVSWIHTDGKQRSNRYQVPNANQCLNCHQQGDQFVPIGPVAANLNGNWDYGHGSRNQLAAWTEQDLLAEAPSPASIDAWPVFGDTRERSIPDRARSWLHVNCAHCHNPRGSARTSGLDLRLTQMNPAKFGVHKVPVAAGHGSGGRSFDIVPGKPDESILLYRIESEDPGIAMPSVGKNLVPIEAAELIRAWIEQLD
jgi:parallel beta-helix repeat protein